MTFNGTNKLYAVLGPSTWFQVL